MNAPLNIRPRQTAATVVNGPSLATLAAPASARVSLELRLMRLKRRGLLIVGTWLALFLSWSFFAPISGGVVANGLIKVEANRLSVTHRDGGTVARILVREGQWVEKGQTLLVLEDTRVNASVDMLRAQMAADRLRQSRLEAEAAGANHWQPPAALATEFKSVRHLADLQSKERNTFAARQANLQAQIQGEQRQAEDTRIEISMRLKERDNSQKAITLMRDELELNQTLEKEQFVNRARIMSLQRGVSEYESRYLGNEAELAQARQRLGGIEARIRALRDGQAQQASEELRDVGTRLSDTEERLRSSSDDQSRQTVVAPAAGRLMNLRINTPGSAIGPREPIVDIVPRDTQLLVEARVPLEVGADVKPGTLAEIKVLTAHSRNDKLMAAEVVQVAADAQEDSRNGAPFLMVQVSVTPQELARAGVPWQAGLMTEVYLKTTERTPVGFLLEPITGYFRRSFRER